MSRLPAALLLIAALPAFTPPAAGRTLTAGPGQAYTTPSAAIAAASPGDTVRITPGTYRDCATIQQDSLVVEGTGRPEEVVLTGAVCQAKAAFVTQGRNITIRALTLRGIEGPDGNGAGIRAEGADLTVERVRFEDDQDGILSAPSPESTITVRDSVFLRNGACNPACAHGIYAGHIRLLRVERSRFVATRVAHHIKSRAVRTEVIDCVLEDTPDGTASYQIDLPNGGSLLARGNTIQKGSRASNPVVISIGAEGITEPDGPIEIEGNRLTVAGTLHYVFVRNLAGVPARLVGNRIPAGVVALAGVGTVR